METGRPMISFSKALETVFENIHGMSVFEEVTLENCTGRILAENISADRDIPPFDRSAVDGYAIMKEDAGKTLRLLEVLPAGSKAKYSVVSGTCIRIMTGAPMPHGAEQVVMVEYSRESGGYVSFDIPEKDKRSLNFSVRGEDMKKGDIAVLSGTVITPGIIATLASLGKYRVKVIKRPRIGIIATGDEIVEPWETPSEENIRNANAWELIAQINRAGGEPVYSGIVKDDEDQIKNAIETASGICDMVLITGGVSMGDYDLGAKALSSAGFEIKFDSVAVKPGKPVTLAVRKDAKGKKDVVLGLPGNPFSVFVMFEVMVRPCIEKMLGMKTAGADMTTVLCDDFKRRKGEREEWVPAKRQSDGSVMPLKYHGSGHFHILSEADSIFRVDTGVLSLKKGDKVSVRYI